MLTPKFTVEGFYVDHDKTDIVDHIKKIIETLCPNKACEVEYEFAKFINMISSLPEIKKQMIYNMNAKAYWNVFGKSEYPALYICANYVFDMVASSASSERVWSAFGFIHSKLRNRLTTTRVEKLISIYVNHAIMEKLDIIDSLFSDHSILEEDED
jgi:hAT family C-terminal dimerisation region